MSTTKRVKKVYTAEDAKKASKRFLIIICLCLSVILVAGLILGFINRPGLNFLADYKSVRIETHTESKTVIKAETDTPDTHDRYVLTNMFNNGLKKTRYSVLRMLLEVSFSQSFKFETEKETYIDDNDKEKTRDVRVELKADEITQHVHAADGEFTLTFTFDRTADGKPAKSVKVEGEEIFFDKAMLTITTDGNNVIESFKIRFYDSEMLYGDSPEVFNYRITPVTVKARTQKFMDSLQEILDYSK